MPVTQVAKLANHALVWIIREAENMLALQRRIAEINKRGWNLAAASRLRGSRGGAIR
jgi:hypothetical protein